MDHHQRTQPLHLTGPDLRPTGTHTPERFEFGYLPEALFAKVKEQIRSNAGEAAKKAVNRDTL